MIKIKQKNVILMSEKISVTLINKGFSQKYGLKVKVSYPLKQGLKTVSGKYPNWKIIFWLK